MENKEVIAQSKYIASSPRKIRLIADAVRGMNANLALANLKYMQKGAAIDVYKTVASAVANASHNFKMNPANLRISKIFIDEAPMFKRIVPQSKGRARRILKRNSHITVYVTETPRYAETESKVEGKAETKAAVKAEVKKEVKAETKVAKPKSSKKLTKANGK